MWEVIFALTSDCEQIAGYSELPRGTSRALAVEQLGVLRALGKRDEGRIDDESDVRKSGSSRDRSTVVDGSDELVDDAVVHDVHDMPHDTPEVADRVAAVER